MRYLWEHFKRVAGNYDGKVPLTHYLREYGRKHPMLGSRDRKLLSDIAYSWYRCEKAIDSDVTDIEQRALMCLALCGKDEVIAKLKADMPPIPDADIDKIFPYVEDLSAGIERGEWLNSMLVQPALFIRIRKDKSKITALLAEHNIPFSFITATCLALPNGAKIDAILPDDHYAVQDASSQATGDYFNPQPNEAWYDCCSGAGGKSLLLKDLESSVSLTTTDVRDTILRNQRERFRAYGLQPPKTMVTDVTDETALARSLVGQRFDNIICDAPCSGSGTWARTPEQMYFFDIASLSRFTSLQSGIAVNAAQYLKPGGRLIYITCSVFQAENEGILAQIQARTRLQPETHRLINGIAHKADSMFVAVLRSPS